MIPNDWLTYLRKSPLRLFFIQPCLGKPMVTKLFRGQDKLTNHYLWDDFQPKARDSMCAILPWKRFYDHMIQTQTTQTLKGLDFVFGLTLSNNCVNLMYKAQKSHRTVHFLWPKKRQQD